MTKTMKPQTPPRFCDHCGARMFAGGRKSKTGRYYCSKVDCRAAKQRDWYNGVYQHHNPEPAPTTCSCCGRPLKPRLRRRDDSPLGRWCSSTRCQRDRALKESPTSDYDSPEMKIARFLVAIEVPERVYTCPQCGLENAVLGFTHPKLVDGAHPKLELVDELVDGEPAMAGPELCWAMGDTGISKELARQRWPEAFAVDWL